jgi:hypothetical protein
MIVDDAKFHSGAFLAGNDLPEVVIPLFKNHLPEILDSYILLPQ